MSINIVQAIILGLFASLSSMPGLGGTSIGNYTLGRPLVGGLICGIVLGDIPTGILVGCAMQVVYIALVTPGGTVSADVRAVSYIGIPLAMIALKSYGLDPASAEGTALATSFGTMVGTIGTVLFYGTATMNLVWQHMGWAWVDKREYDKLPLVDYVFPWISHICFSLIPTVAEYDKLPLVDYVFPWISHICFSLIPTVAMCMAGEPVVNLIKERLPMDGIPMKTLFTVGALLPCVGIAILLKQIVRNVLDFIPYLFGFTLAASMGINLVASTVVAGLFAILIFKLKMLELRKPAAASSSAAADNGWDDDEEDI